MTCLFIFHTKFLFNLGFVGARIAQSVKQFVFVWRLATNLFRRGFKSRWWHASKKMLSGEKKIYHWKSLWNVWVVWLYLPGCGVSQSISQAAKNYPGFYPPQDSRANAPLEAESLNDLTSIS